MLNIQILRCTLALAMLCGLAACGTLQAPKAVPLAGGAIDRPLVMFATSEPNSYPILPANHNALEPDDSIETSFSDALGLGGQNRADLLSFSARLKAAMNGGFTAGFNRQLQVLLQHKAPTIKVYDDADKVVSQGSTGVLNPRQLAGSGVFLALPKLIVSFVPDPRTGQMLPEMAASLLLKDASDSIIYHGRYLVSPVPARGWVQLPFTDPPLLQVGSLNADRVDDVRAYLVGARKVLLERFISDLAGLAGK